MFGAIAFFTSCATTYDLPEKYAAYIGKQFRTRSDAYIWEMPRHEYEFSPYHLISSWPLGKKLEHIPAGTIVTIKAAKRSYKGGDWDYLIAEVRAPKSGKIYEFEDMLGFSNYFPGDIEKFLEPVDKTQGAGAAFKSDEYFNAPNGRFSIRKSAFDTPPVTYSVTEPIDQGSFSFNFPLGGIVRIDYWITKLQPLDRWITGSQQTNIHDRTIDGVENFTRTKTGGLKELTLLARRPSADSEGGMSAAAFRMHLEGRENAGTYYRGFLAFSQGTDSYVVHYQTSDSFPNDKAAGETVLEKLVALKRAMVFHTQ